MTQEAITSASDAPERQLCIRCLEPNDPESNFCSQCGAPLSAYASTGPFESVFAEGAVYREAVQHPSKLIVVVGIWVIFGLFCFGGALMIAVSGDLFDQVLGVLLVAFSLFVVWGTTRRFLARPRPTQSDA